MSGKRKVDLISREEKTARALVKQLDQLLGDFITFIPYAQKKWLKDSSTSDTVIVSTHILAHDVAQNAGPETEIIILRRTLLKESWEKVLEIPQGTKLMLVNYERDAAMETIALLYELGARHINPIPVYPELEKIPKLNIALTPGERRHVPGGVRNIIDIGDRVVDVSTLVDILTRFDLFNNETMNIVDEYANKIIPRSLGLQAAMRGLMNLKNLFQESLDIVGDGVITYDEKEHITVFNKAAEDIFSRRASSVLGRNVKELLQENGIDLKPKTGQVQNKLFRIGQQDIIITEQCIENNGEITGGVITLQIATKVREVERKLRLQLEAKGHHAQYSFKDLVFQSQAMEKAVEIAKKIADNPLNVLILGETGTGKEIFAHAIHRASPRGQYPFVAVNCSALPGSLLESELFGYEEGAFTGARKGGKPGLFEQAHRGTIFLDEIGDISPSMQARLLRVVQQKEIQKIGGTSVLPVDVRIIAATNRDLEELVEDGSFRADLYHRLNVLQLRVPSLNERREDILPLTRYFLKKRGFKGKLDKKVLEHFKSYHWPGNVRELENVLDFLTAMNNNEIREEDIPFWGKISLPRNKLIEKEVPEECFGEASEEKVFELVYQARSRGETVGRRSLVKIAREAGISMTEKKAQIYLKNLAGKGLIEIKRGRGGCRMTEAGFREIQKRGKNK